MVILRPVPTLAFFSSSSFLRTGQGNKGKRKTINVLPWTWSDILNGKLAYGFLDFVHSEDRSSKNQVLKVINCLQQGSMTQGNNNFKTFKRIDKFRKCIYKLKHLRATLSFTRSRLASSSIISWTNNKHEYQRPSIASLYAMKNLHGKNTMLATNNSG